MDMYVCSEQSQYSFQKDVCGELAVNRRGKLSSSGLPPPADVLRAHLLHPTAPTLF